MALELAGTGGIGADGDSSDGDRDKDEDDSDSDNGGGGGGAVPRGAVCDHPCCAARPFCIIAELRRTRDVSGAGETWLAREFVGTSLFFFLPFPRR